MAPPPEINLTVLVVRGAWASIALRRALRAAPGGGRAEPMTLERRHDAYRAQNPTGMRKYTPAQRRRRDRKLGRAINRSLVDPGKGFI